MCVCVCVCVCVSTYVLLLQLKAIQMQRDEVGHKQEKRKKEITDMEAKVGIVYTCIHAYVREYVHT